MEEAPDDSLFVKLHVKSLHNNIPNKKKLMISTLISILRLILT